MEYPAEHFPGTPPLGIWVVSAAIKRAGVVKGKWTVPLEAIARYESDWDPYTPDRGTLRGLMQQSVGQYGAFGGRTGADIDYRDPVLAVRCAIEYIKGNLVGYGGYDGIEQLLARNDRGPGRLLRYWLKNPDATYAEMRDFYNGY